MGEWRDAAAFLTMATFWGLNYPLVKVALGSVGPLQLLFLRIAVGLPFLAALLPRSMRPLAGLRLNLLVALFGVLDVVLMQSLWFYGEAYVSPSTASLLIYTYPVIVTALSLVLLGERVTGGRAIGLALGFTGTAILLSGGLGPAPPTGIAPLMGAALSWSLATVLYRKYLREEDFARVNAYHLIYALPISAALAASEGSLASIRWTPGAIAALLLIAFPGTAVAFTIYVYLYSRHEVNRVAPYMFLVPALSMAFSYAILGTPVTAEELLGYSVLAAGIYFSTRG
ncbi:MAG: DMT family transporter [Conexivisphaera sp.]